MDLRSLWIESRVRQFLNPILRSVHLRSFVRVPSKIEVQSSMQQVFDTGSEYSGTWLNAVSTPCGSSLR